MALLSAAPEEQKRNLNLVLNEENGGTTTRAYIFTEGSAHRQSRSRLQRPARRARPKLEKEVGADVRSAARAAPSSTTTTSPASASGCCSLALSLMSFLFLLVVFRSVLLAAKAVVLNLITVGAAMGLVALLYSGKAPAVRRAGLDGGDVVLRRLLDHLRAQHGLRDLHDQPHARELPEDGLKRAGDPRRRDQDGRHRDRLGAGDVRAVRGDGADASDLVSSAQLGLGLAFAIAIDATIVRLVLLPATMRLFGDANWWIPRWLDRSTPNVAIH